MILMVLLASSTHSKTLMVVFLPHLVNLLILSLLGTSPKRCASVVPFLSLSLPYFASALSMVLIYLYFYLFSHALLAFGHLGLPFGDKSSLENYVKSLWDSESRLYAARKGEKGSIRATAYALQSLDILGASSRDWAVKASDEVRKGLKDFVQDNAFVFPADSGLDELSANYYGIVAASFSNFKFDDVESWASYFSELQVREGRAAGGYLANKAARQVSIVTTSRAVSALYYLGKATGKSGLVDAHCDVRSLARFVQLIPHDLQAASYAFLAVSRTGLFEELFQKQATYEVLNGEVTETAVIQGTQLKPIVSVRTFFGVPHAGLTVEAVLTHKSVGTKNLKLAWNQEAQQYQASEFFDSADKLGELTIVYSARLNLAGDSITFTIRDTKKIGYYIKVKSTANLAGKDIEANGVIGVGTVFSHSVSLATQSKAKVNSGDFDVVYSVVDSAGAVIHTEKKDGRNYKDSSFTFNFELKTSDFPAGAVSHRFEVRNADGAHTAHVVAYQLNLPMVASHITFKGVSGTQPSFKIGETITVTMQPGSLPDLRTVVPYLATDASGAKSGELRQFFMDTFAGEQLTRSIRGKASEGDNGQLVYTFEIPVTATFDSIGKQRIAFRYQSRATGAKPVALANFDSASGELYDEAQPLTFVVNAKLQVVDLTNAPADGALSYGDEVAFTFKVVDTLSGKNVWVNSESPSSTVDLVLKADNVVADRHSAEQKSDESGKPSSFAINWAVSANAKKGAATLELAVASGDADVALQTKDGKNFKVSVTVGGEIEVSHEVHQVNSLENFHNAFTVEFSLSCKSKSLAGAQLRSVVKTVGSSGQSEVVAALPVASNSQNGIYAVSYVGVDEVARSGKYQIELFREVDTGAQPLFVVNFDFDAGSSELLPVRTETIVLLTVVGSFLFFSLKKLRLERQK